jgi:hypothetical protein
MGFYAGIIRNVGDVFDVSDADFADAAINYLNPALIPSTAPFWGWMRQVPDSEPLFNAPPAFPGATTLRRSVY